MIRWKRYACAAVCGGLTCMIAGGGLFFARSDTAYREEKIEPMETLRLSAFTELDARQDIRLCAHRGLSATTPENTLEAVRAAGEAGYSLVLLDVTLTKDGQAVLLADETIDRMTIGRGRVSDYTYTQLFEFPLDNGANLSDYGRVQIPLLRDALTVCDTYGMLAIVSLRTVHGGNAEPLLRQTQGAYMIVSERRDVLQMLAGHGGKLCLRVGALRKEDIQYALANGYCLAYDPREPLDTLPDPAAQAQLWAWPVNTRDQIDKTVGAGVRNVITDCILPMK